ncbi:MAG TPA: hypothetical protein VH054_19085, partial [Polyangiaceae bacterium]|nr:hypothetical protein [Polyangiaceae bacterium]
MRPSIRRIRLGIAGAAFLLAGALHAAEDAGLDAGAVASADGGHASETETETRTGQIRALIAGTLPVGVAPQSLFEVRLTDEQAVQVEAVRLRALLRTVDAADAGTEHKAAKPIASSSPITTMRTEIEALDPAQWSARDALDRARLDFYSLSESQRAALLSAQAARVEAAKPKETDEERRAREANEERQRALEAARTARSEAERLVGTELARLIGVERAVATAQDGFKDVRVDLAARNDSLLGWQRRVTEAQAGSALAADETYDAVRKTLRGSRDDLD